jgi:hypothetical protein
VIDDFFSSSSCLNFQGKIWDKMDNEADAQSGSGESGNSPNQANDEYGY